MSTEMTDDDVAAVSGDNEGFFEKGKGTRSGLFFFIFDGTLCLKSPEPRDGFEPEPIKTQNPRTKETVLTYVKRYDKIIVRIVDVNKREVKFDSGGKVRNWNFTLLAGQKKAVLQATWCDAFLSKFLKVAPNIDFNKSVLISAFRTHNPKKAGADILRISIRQGGSDATSNDWQAVPFYWQRDMDDPNSDSVGRDGSILPQPVQDEDDDTWDFKAQEKFLAKHFVDNTLPKIKAIADKLGIKDMADAEDDFPTHTGGAGDVAPVEEEVAPVTKKPDNAESTGPADAMTTKQATRIRHLAKILGKSPDKFSNKMFDIDFDDLSKDGASYLQYKLEKKIRLAREEDPSSYPDPDGSAIKAVIEADKAKKAKTKSEDDWDDDDDDPAPKKSKPKSDVAPYDPDDDDDIPF